MLTRSLPPADIARSLDLPAEVLDALLESGRVLCQVKKGERMIPLAQLESFFRDALVAVYRAEAEATHAAAPVAEEHAKASEERVEEPAPPPPVTEAVAAPPPVAPPREVVVPDHRRAARYVPLRQIDGIFNDTRFSIVQLSATGIRIRHREPLLPGDEAKVSFALLKPARSFVMRARVVWTSVGRIGEETFSISGLRVTEHGERLARAIELLEAAHELQPERRERVRRDADSLAKLEGISDDEIALITGAMQKFASDPVEAHRWYSRARFALSDENVRAAAPSRPRDREEVLGIWEYLERQVDIPKVAGVVSWMRRAG